ncbi:MAG: hypothetical protein OXE92_04570 [Bacteroidetes bacterium]|nr:hypothetical protein [Bacteroidota bacterium]MCY4204983.1 hypothetical protein [Bacteroidota bacterium]
MSHIARDLYHSPPTERPEQAQVLMQVDESPNPDPKTHSGLHLQTVTTPGAKEERIQEIADDKVALNSEEEVHLHIQTFNCVY